MGLIVRDTHTGNKRVRGGVKDGNCDSMKSSNIHDCCKNCDCPTHCFLIVAYHSLPLTDQRATLS